MASGGKHISLPKPFALGDPVEWFQRFEICSRANDWEDEMKAKKLPTLLEGESLVVRLELTPEEQTSYAMTKEKIVSRMAPVRFVSLSDFHRKLHPGESLSVSVHELKQLLGQAIPYTNADTSKQLLLHQFISGLPVSINKQLRAVGQINNLDTALERAKLLMTLEGPENTAVQTTEVEVLKEQISLLTEQVAALTTRQTRQQGNVTCYRCHQPGHLQPNCPLTRKCYLCGRPGHLAKECRLGNSKGVPQMGWEHPKKQ